LERGASRNDRRHPASVAGFLVRSESIPKMSSTYGGLVNNNHWSVRSSKNALNSKILLTALRCACQSFCPRDVRRTEIDCRAKAADEFSRPKARSGELGVEPARSDDVDIAWDDQRFFAEKKKKSRPAGAVPRFRRRPAISISVKGRCRWRRTFCGRRAPIRHMSAGSK